MKLKDKRLATKVVKVDYENSVYEIILTTIIDGEFINFNLLFIQNNFAQSVDIKLLNDHSDELYAKYIREEEIHSPRKVLMPKIARKLTKLDKEIKEILKSFDKTLKINREHIIHKNRYIVSNPVSPNEIWLNQAYNAEQNLKDIQNRLVKVYSQIEVNTELNIDDWNINSLCVWKHPKYQIYKRGKIVEKNENNTVKFC